jgi:hypothetical protein
VTLAPAAVSTMLAGGGVQRRSREVKYSGAVMELRCGIERSSAVVKPRRSRGRRRVVAREGGVRRRGEAEYGGAVSERSRSLGIFSGRSISAGWG